MTGLPLQTRFILAGCLLVASTIGSSVWSAVTFARLSAVVDTTLRESQETIDLSAELHSSLEREDDALLLFLSGEARQARRDLGTERHRGDAGFDRLTARLQDGEEEERAIAADLRRQIDRYRAAGDELTAAGPRDGLEQYHRRVNPLLRQAAAGCDKLREANFRSMEQAGVRARDEAARGARLVGAISVLTVVLGVAVAVWLARSVLRPVRELTDSVEGIRAGDFDRRVRHAAGDELGRLAAGFNRMAESLAEYRRSSLGELLAAKTTLEATLNALPDAVLVFAPDGTLAAANPPASTVLDALGVRPAAGLSGLPLAGGYLDAIRQALGGARPTAPPFDFDRTLQVRLAGRLRRFMLTAVPVPEFTPGRFGAVAVLDDVTEFARLDELRSELVGVASHELNSPLTALRMNLLMLVEGAGELSDRHRELVTSAVAGCEELGTTIEELLDVTRIEAGQLRLNLTRVDLRTLVTAVADALRGRFDDAGVGLVIESGEGPAVVRGDAPRLRSVLANVLTNALKYSPHGGTVSIRISSPQNAQAEGDDALQIAVTDEGPGVPAEFRERVFEKFFRVEHHTGGSDGNVRGTGIGLYLCREIVKAHGGRITCEPTASGVGTNLAITFNQ